MMTCDQILSRIPSEKRWWIARDSGHGRGFRLHQVGHQEAQEWVLRAVSVFDTPLEALRAYQENL